MLEAQSLDDVGRALDLCEDAGIPIVTTLGKHSNDHVISFYLETPSGFSLEYGWNGRLIDDAAWEAPINEAGDLWGHRRPRAADEAARRPDPARTQFPWLLRPEPLEATR